MTKIRVGVVGVGHLGYHHARIYKELEQAELVAVADVSEEARNKAAADFGVTAVDSVEALLDLGVSAISVATPTETHCDIVLTALCQGVHVLVEKPLASTIDEGEAMVKEAAERKLLLQVGHVERFNGAVLALFEAGLAPKFIECHRLSPFPGRGSDVSVVLDLMIHDLDIVMKLADSPVKSIDAVGVPVFSEQEDIANVRLRFESGCVANLTSSRVSLERMRKIRIFDPNAYVSTDYSAQEVLVYSKKPGALPPDANPMESISIRPLPVKKEEPLKLELASFLDDLRANAPVAVSGEDGLQALKLSWQILDAIRNNQ